MYMSTKKELLEKRDGLIREIAQTIVDIDEQKRLRKGVCK